MAGDIPTSQRSNIPTAAAVALFVLVTAAAAAPIRSYDYFWHLATGRWIVEHRAIPATDPLAVASAKTPWINGEWLYEVVLYATRGANHALLNALLVAAIFTAAYLFAARQNEWTVALIAAAVAFAGASDRLGVRPSTAAALFVVVAIGVLQRSAGVPIAYVVLTILWINIHPSALLAPVIALFFGRWIVAAVSALALLVNPHGWHAVRAPFELTSFAGSGAFVNAEWLPSDPRLFPLLYITAIAMVIGLIATREKRIWRWAIFGMLLVLAARHVRYQNFYFAALPLLVPPMRISRLKPAATLAAALIPIVWAFLQTDHKLGVDDSRFPVRAVGAMSGLPGNIYNVDQFGGFLEWTFYPERRVLTDGRNELFREFIAEDQRAREDSRAWNALIAKYNVTLAVDEYSSQKIEVVDAVTGERKLLPSSLVRYRRREWALIAFDDAAMVFARRSKFRHEHLAPLEYRYVVPDDPSRRYPKEARDEIARARSELGDIRVVRQLEAAAN